MTDEMKREFLLESIRSSFDAVFQLDLINGVYQPVFSGGVDLSQGTQSYDYADFAGKFTEKYAISGKAESLRKALSLDTVREAIKSGRKYEVYGGTKFGQNAIDYKKLSFMPCGNGRYAFLAISDFGSLADYYNEELRRMAEGIRLDILTGAYTRNYYETEMKHASFAGGVALIDIDDFKLCNDLYGHDVGDLALIETSKAIRSNIMEKDILIRYGGDELLLLLPEATPERMDSVLEKIRADVSEVKNGKLGGIRLSISVGGVMTDKGPITDAVYRADRIMYLAKRQKNTVMTDRKIESNSEKQSGDDKERPHVLIVDDSEFNRELLCGILGESFEILEADSGKEGLKLLRRYGTQISVVLLDIIMPEMNGFDVLDEMNREHWLDNIPVIMISADDSDENIRRAFDLGVTDYICRPFDAKVVERRIRNTITLNLKQRRMLSLLAEQSRDKEKIGQMMVDILSNTVCYVNGESGQHIRNIQRITAILLERLLLKTDRYRLSFQDCVMISTASALHDIGKVGINTFILNKPGILTPEEYEVMKKHTLIGEHILKSGELSEFREEPLLKTAEQICRWHHERYDGSGYPDGLSGEEIPIAAQVVSIADVFDALMSKRSYKEALSAEVALRMIENGECGSFNPVLIECLKQAVGKLESDVYES
jgi:putative two-component system response regulator